MTPEEKTKLVLTITVIVLSIYDVYMIWTYGPRASISEVIVTCTKDYPIIALIFGLICGHLFWRF